MPPSTVRPRRTISPRRRGNPDKSEFCATTTDATRQIVLVPTESILESDENWSLYKKPKLDDPEFKSFVESIQRDGILDPLQLSSDGYLISGHRRLTAARTLGLESVPAIILPIRRSEYSAEDWVRLLREHNRQRPKSLDELTRETLVDVNREDAYRALLAHQARESDQHANSIRIRGTKQRAEISAAKRPFLEAAIEALDARGSYWPTTVRAIHYDLLSLSLLLKHAGKPQSVYRNDRASYQDLCDLLARARLAGEVPWEAITDETRPVVVWRVWNTMQPFLEHGLKGLLQGYSRNVLQSQPDHIECVCEKMAAQTIVRRACVKYRIPFTVGRGFASLHPRHEIAERFAESGKDRLVLLFLSDCDPDGDEISESFARSMRDDFEIDEDRLVPIRVALTHQQADEHGLHTSLEAKQSSANYKKFVRRHRRTDAFELEACPPELLQELLDEAIRSVLDIDAFNSEVELEKDDAAHLEAQRIAILKAIGKLTN